MLYPYIAGVLVLGALFLCGFLSSYRESRNRFVTVRRGDGCFSVVDKVTKLIWDFGTHRSDLVTWSGAFESLPRTELNYYRPGNELFTLPTYQQVAELNAACSKDRYRKLFDESLPPNYEFWLKDFPKSSEGSEIGHYADSYRWHCGNVVLHFSPENLDAWRTPGSDHAYLVMVAPASPEELKLAGL